MPHRDRSPRAGGRAVAAASLVVLVLPIVGWGVACRGEPSREAGAQVPPAAASAEPVPVFTGGANQVQVTLFFVSADGESLAPEPRRIFRTATVNDRARQALQALFEGSQSGLLPSVPPGTLLRELYLARDGTAYVDMGSEFKRAIEVGSSDAVYAVYGIVNTLAYNFPDILKVKILIDGDEAEDVGGHLDLSRPILPEMSLVSTLPAGPLTVPPSAPEVAPVVPAPVPEPSAAPPPDEGDAYAASTPGQPSEVLP